MRSHARSRFLLLVFLLIPLLLLACRRDPDDEVTPTVPAVTEAPATETPPPAPTNTPVPVATVDVADITWPPQVIYSSPAPGEEVTLNGAITIRFDQPMDQASVESAFAVTDNESSETYEVVPVGKRPPTEKLDSSNILLLVHTKRISA